MKLPPNICPLFLYQLCEKRFFSSVRGGSCPQTSSSSSKLGKQKACEFKPRQRSLESAGPHTRATLGVQRPSPAAGVHTARKTEDDNRGASQVPQHCRDTFILPRDRLRVEIENHGEPAISSDVLGLWLMSKSPAPDTHACMGHV